jgi:hypothetical protein
VRSAPWRPLCIGRAGITSRRPVRRCRKGRPLAELVSLTFWANISLTHTSTHCQTLETCHLDEMQHSINTAQQDDEPGGGRLNWRQRKKATMRRQQLVAGYVQVLGGADRISSLQMAEVMRAVDMTLLAEGMRAKALRGEPIDIGDMIRLEGAVSRVIRSLNLPPPGAAAAPGDATVWRQFLASHEGGE